MKDHNCNEHIRSIGNNTSHYTIKDSQLNLLKTLEERSAIKPRSCCISLVNVDITVVVQGYGGKNFSRGTRNSLIYCVSEHGSFMA
jgi:hypothetical protein